MGFAYYSIWNSITSKQTHKFENTQFICKHFEAHLAHSPKKKKKKRHKTIEEQ